MENKDIDAFDLIKNNSLYSNILSSLHCFIDPDFDKIAKEFTNMSQIATEIQEYINDQCQLFIKIYTNSSSSFSSATMPFNQYEMMLESFESIITKGLYPKLMSLLGTDIKFDRLTLKYSFLTEEYLGLPIKFDIFELQKKLNIFKEDMIEKMTPKGKLIAIKNLSNYLSFYLNDNALLYKGILFSIVKSTIPNIKSYIRYCSLFRNKTLITTEEEILLINVTKAFDYIDQLSLGNIHDLIIPLDKFKELNNEFEKMDLISSLRISNGHFPFNNFIDDRLLALINSGKDNWNSLYESESEVKEKDKERQELNDNIALNKQSITQMIQYYYHIDAKDTKMSELNHIRSLFKHLLKLILKEKHQ